MDAAATVTFPAPMSSTIMTAVATPPSPNESQEGASTSAPQTSGPPLGVMALPPGPDRAAHGSAVLLSLPPELWHMILEYDVEAEDIISLRLVSRVYRQAADAVLPLVARRMFPEHANDAFIGDSLYAEALLASHRHSTPSPFMVLVARDGSNDTFDGKAVAAPQVPPPKISAEAISTQDADKGKGKEKETTDTQTPLTNLPSRAEWMVGSRRVLHTLHVRGRPWPFGLCSTCRRGLCKGCLKLKANISTPTEAWWWVEQNPVVQANRYSNAIFASDALFCAPCRDIQGQSADEIQKQYADTVFSYEQNERTAIPPPRPRSWPAARGSSSSKARLTLPASSEHSDGA